MSPWANPIVVVKKHTPEVSPQQFCLCIDYRELNPLLPAVKRAMGTKEGAVTLMPLPNIDALFTLLKGAKYFTALDLHSCYYHIILDYEYMPKRAFTMVFGNFKFPRLPLVYPKIQTSSFDYFMTFSDWIRHLTKAKAQDV